MGFSRRHFISTSLLALAAACSPSARSSIKIGESCKIDTRSARVRIDSHCHLMNLQDVSAGPFLARRTFNLDENAPPGVDAIAGFLANALGRMVRFTTKPILAESLQLSDEIKAGVNAGTISESRFKFCRDANQNQKGLMRAERVKITGLFSNRTRNAARMMAIFPEVDIFMPSIVDLYDKRLLDKEVAKQKVELQNRTRKTATSFGSLTHQMNYYRDLNIATNGQFLPMISFNPQRQYDLERLKAGYDYIDIVKEAILEHGFVGVKMHPSSGFSPFNNLLYGCANTATQIVLENDQKLYERFSSYDKSLKAVFKFCQQHDVPVMTHNSTGLSSNRRCMRRSIPLDDELPMVKPTGPFGSAGEWRYQYRQWGGKDTRPKIDWTNSPREWMKAIDDCREDGLPDLRVSLGHLSGSFIDHGANSKNERTDVMASEWLTYTAKHIGNYDSLYVDLSEINEFFVRKTGQNGKTIGISRRYYDAFHQVLQGSSGLADRLLYGTDWHMPNSARTGKYYVRLIEHLLQNDRLRDKTMGQNAIDFYGLGMTSNGQQERPNRARLREFYAKHKIPLEKVRWWDRVL